MNDFDEEADQTEAELQQAASELADIRRYLVEEG